jgi:mRNA-degrading endonuclease RelE of RelBE toxin-antitoxin system
MTKYTAILSKSFFRELGKLSAQQQKMVLKKLKILESNPYYPSLRTKKVLGIGTRDERYESSINMDIRVIWRFEENKIIIVLDVGHHDVLKKY